MQAVGTGELHSRIQEEAASFQIFALKQPTLPPPLTPFTGPPHHYREMGKDKVDGARGGSSSNARRRCCSSESGCAVYKMLIFWPGYRDPVSLTCFLCVIDRPFGKKSVSGKLPAMTQFPAPNLGTFFYFEPCSVLTGFFFKVEDEMERMLERAQEKFLDPLEAFRKDRIGSVRKTRKDFDKRTSRACAAQDRHANVSARREEALAEAAEAARAERRQLDAASLQYVYLMHVVQERKKFEFVEAILGFMHSWTNYYR